jgi:hypothetical protein
MPTFSINPTSGFPPAASSNFPNYLQWQQNGVNLGAPTVDTVDLVNGITATRGTGENANVLTVSANQGLTWNHQTTAYQLALSDANNGVAMDVIGEVTTLTIPNSSDVPFIEGTSILIYNEGVAIVQVAAASGVVLHVRLGLSANLAGQYAVATLLYRSPNVWVLCGDLGLV